MLITPLFVRSSFLLTVIALFTNADYPIVVRSSFFLLKKHERQNNGLISIGGQHNNLK
jgi:hypothetical protein